LIVKRSVGRPQSADLEDRLTSAAVALVEAAGTIQGLTIDAICDRAGASKASFYRRWPDRGAFLAALLDHLREPVLQPSQYQDIRTDLMRLMRDVIGIDFRRTRLMTSAMLAGGTLGNELVARYMREHVIPRRRAFMARLQHGVETGELHADTDLSALHDLLTAPMLKFLVFVESADPLPEDVVGRLVDQALRGAGA
jgi:AcrR family transcriptional regulator